MYSDRSLQLSTPDLILGTEHMIHNAMPQFQSTSTLMSSPETPDVYRLGNQPPTISAGSPYQAGTPSSAHSIVGQHRVGFVSSPYRGGYHSPTTFSQPQMPGSVLQPTIPGYHVSYSPTINGCQRVTSGASQQVCNTWSNTLNCSVNTQQNDTHPSGLDLLNVAQPERMSETSICESDVSDKSGWIHSVPGTFPWSQSMGHNVQFVGRFVDRLPGKQKSRKRRSDEELNYASKLHITEARLKDLSLHREDVTARPYMSTGQPSASTALWGTRPEGGGGVGVSDVGSHWPVRGGYETLEEIDSRLQVDSDEEDANNNNNNEQTAVDDESLLVLSNEVSQHIRTAQEILPKACLQSWTQPSMQVVLWRPPGDQIAEIIDSRLKTPDADCSSSGDSGAISVDRDINALDKQENETDACVNVDDFDDFMDL